MRLPLVVPIMSRDGTLAKGSKLVNVYTEGAGGRPTVYSRPGISTAANSLVGYGNGIYGPAGLSSATVASDSGVVYTFVDNTFAKTYDTGGIDSGSLGAMGVSTVITGGVPFFFQGNYYVHKASTFIKKTSLTEGTASTWGVATTSASMTWGSYVRPFRTNGKMYLWKPYGETGGGDFPYLSESSDGTTWSTQEVSTAGAPFYSGEVGNFYSLVVTKSTQETAWWLNVRLGQTAWNSTGIFPASVANSSYWHQATGIVDNNVTTAATGKEYIVTDNTNFYLAVENSTYSVPVPYGITTAFWHSTWTLLNSSCGFGSTSTQVLGIYKGKFVLSTGNSSSTLWISNDFVNWTEQTTTATAALGYFDDSANAMLASSSHVYFFNNYDTAYSSTQTTIGSINNPSNVPIDFVQSE